jgi:predicted nuclease of predicted toxin-antitoxin system
LTHFLVDANLPPALARWLRSQGHAAEHVAEHGLIDSPDAMIWQLAESLSAVVITKDEDFAHRRMRSAATHPSIVWVRVPNVRRQAFLRWFEQIFPRLLRRSIRGRPWWS